MSATPVSPTTSPAQEGSALRDHLLRIQMAAHRRNLRLIRKSYKPDRILSAYARGYDKHLTHYEAISSRHDLIRRAVASDVVYHGDYHTLPQSQLSVYRILREVLQKRSLVVCLEMLHASDQRAIDAFMAGKISQPQFLASIDYERRWGFKWEYWRPILDLCRNASIPVYGINSDQFDHSRHSLRLRDIFSSKVIGKLVLANPGKLVYVVDGDFHISPNHLPREVDQRLKVFDVEPKRTIIHQNADNLYWHLARQGLEEVDVLQLCDDSFCLMNTTPIEKTQSHLNWLEFTEDTSYSDYDQWDEFLAETEVQALPNLIRTVCEVIGIKCPISALERLNVFRGRGLDLLETVAAERELAGLRPAILQKVRNGEGFLIEYGADESDSYLMYLPTHNLAIAAEEATHFVNAVARGRIKAGLSRFDTFYRHVITEALGFFGSKLINARRKTASVGAIRAMMGRARTGPPSAEQTRRLRIARLILQHGYLEKRTSDPSIYKKRFPAVFRHREQHLFTAFGTQLGYLLGERIYLAVKKNRIGLGEIQALFRDPFSEPNRALSAYLDLSRRLRLPAARSKSTPTDPALT